MFVSMPSDGSSAPVRFEYGGGKCLRKSLGVSTICPSASIIFMATLLEFRRECRRAEAYSADRKVSNGGMMRRLFIEKSDWVEIIDAGRL